MLAISIRSMALAKCVSTWSGRSELRRVIDHWLFDGCTETSLSEEVKRATATAPRTRIPNAHNAVVAETCNSRDWSNTTSRPRNQQPITKIHSHGLSIEVEKTTNLSSGAFAFGSMPQCQPDTYCKQVWFATSWGCGALRRSSSTPATKPGFLPQVRLFSSALNLLRFPPTPDSASPSGTERSPRNLFFIFSSRGSPNPSTGHM